MRTWCICVCMCVCLCVLVHVWVEWPEAQRLKRRNVTPFAYLKTSTNFALHYTILKGTYILSVHTHTHTHTHTQVPWRMCAYTHSHRNKKNIVFLMQNKERVVLFLEHTHAHTQRSALGYARNIELHATGQICWNLNYAPHSSCMHQGDVWDG
jgi:hypothetical protein